VLGAGAKVKAPFALCVALRLGEEEKNSNSTADLDSEVDVYLRCLMSLFCLCYRSPLFKYLVG